MNNTKINYTRRRIVALLTFLATIAILIALISKVVGLIVAPSQEETDNPNDGQPVANGVTDSDPSNGQAITDAASAIMTNMSLDEKIYQLLFVTPESLTGVGTVVQAGEATKSALTNYPVGGIIYFEKNLKSKQQITDMLTNTRNYCKTPPFLGVDQEGGRVTRLSSVPEFTVFPPMASIGKDGDFEKAYDAGKTIGTELKSVGFNLNFAPVADIFQEGDNAEIGDRSFGSEPFIVSQMVSKNVAGLQESGVCAVLKHFPGHSSTTSDSHQGYSGSPKTLDEFRAREFMPFQEGIKAGAEFILMSHMTATSIETKPASLSKKIVTEILRTELGYRGIIITDSLSMGAITTAYTPDEAAVQALEAGVDMLLIPVNIKSSVDGIKSAITSGTLTEQRINESVMRILTAKLRMNIISP